VTVSWLLESRTLWSACALALAASLAIIFFSPLGLPALRKREAELTQLQKSLATKARTNRELLDEVKRLSAKDPELLEALARRQGFARPGETVYTFRDSGAK